MANNQLMSKPFQPIIYNPDLGDLSLLLAPPYDVIDEKQCEQLLSRHPYNAVRLILPPSLHPDDPSRYHKAAALWQQWLSERVLIEISEPSVFVLSQRFSLNGSLKEHLMLLTTIPLSDFESGLVKPHEHTMPKPKSDRLNLVRLTGAEFGQVHGLLSDEKGEWSKLLQTVVTEPVWLKGSLDGVENLVWRVTDRGFNEEVNRFLSSQWLVIADGHHRYETALAFREEIPEAKLNPDHPANFIGIVLADYQHNATVLPTHRLLLFHKPESAERFLQEIRRLLCTNAVEWDGTDERLRQLFANLDGIPFLLVAQERIWFLTVRGTESSILRPLEQLPQPLRLVDTAVLHQAILPVVLAAAGVRPEDLTIDYTHDAQVAHQFAQRSGNVAILLRPIPLELVRKVAEQGYRLPPKTTYFVPKIPSGLVMRKILNRQI
ncbi:MAG: DUF1015 domain-containing protein [Armatimonadetes bacterium]|nr:DUF1015 domain-containing protein [Armatimonadota bacterium]